MLECRKWKNGYPCLEGDKMKRMIMPGLISMMLVLGAAYPIHAGDHPDHPQSAPKVSEQPKAGSKASKRSKSSSKAVKKSTSTSKASEQPKADPKTSEKPKSEHPEHPK